MRREDVFVDRERELAFLKEAYRKNVSQLIVVYGKRRVGKTELIKQFVRDVPHIYYIADRASEKEQLQSLSERVGLLFRDEFLLSRGFGNWQEFFRYVRNKERFVIVIDEFPYLIDTNRAIPSIFQKGWDEDLHESGIFLILLGSSIGMMETEVLDYRSPLFGRRTGQMLIEPLGYQEARQFFPGKTAEEFLQFYAVLGGMPAYLLQFDPRLDLWSNIHKNILTPEAYLFREPEFILREELREPRNYFSILRAISLGKTRPGEIINETGFDKNIVGKYLSVLTDLKIVKREVPITEVSFEKSKKGIYGLDDHFFRFWFGYVYPNRGFVEEGAVNHVIESKIKPGFDMFVSSTFEDVCRSFVRKTTIGGMRFSQVGRWWSKDGEIDVVAMGEDGNTILFGEAKWSRQAVGADVLDDLKKKAPLVGWKNSDRNEVFALFSRNKFTPALKRRAMQENVFLFSVSEIDVG